MFLQFMTYFKAISTILINDLTSDERPFVTWAESFSEAIPAASAVGLT